MLCTTMDAAQRGHYDEFTHTRKQPAKPMQAKKHQPIAAPCAWTGAEMKHRTDWLRPFSATEVAEIDSALQAVKRRGIDLFDIEKNDFPLPNFTQGLAKISQALESGNGMILLRGLVRGGVPCREGWWRDVTQFRKNRTGIHANKDAAKALCSASSVPLPLKGRELTL